MLQLEPLIPSTDLWPGGIPACLRVEPSSVEWFDMAEITKGWLQFVQVRTSQTIGFLLQGIHLTGIIGRMDRIRESG